MIKCSLGFSIKTYIAFISRFQQSIKNMSLHTLATLLLIKYFPTILSACKSITFSEMVFYFLEMPIEPIEIKFSHRLTEDKTTTSKNSNKISSVLFMNECQKKKKILILALKFCFLFLVSESDC